MMRLLRKARLVAKGFLKRPHIDFNEIFAPVVKTETIRLVAAYSNWPMYQHGVKSDFLNGPLEEEVYLKQLPRFEKA